jgi:hypothetical protein
LRCLSCKYDLSNLTEHRCPECGGAFDPTDPRTFDNGKLRRIWIYLICAPIWILTTYPLVFVAWLVASYYVKNFQGTTRLPNGSYVGTINVDPLPLGHALVSSFLIWTALTFWGVIAYMLIAGRATSKQ